MSKSKRRPKAKPRTRKEPTTPCTNCKAPTTALFFCHGCQHTICFDCDLPNDLGDYPMGPHVLTDHILSARRRA